MWIGTKGALQDDALFRLVTDIFRGGEPRRRLAEAMQQELKPFGIQVQTINPGAYLTGFNEAMAENVFRWLDDNVNFTARATMRDMVEALIGSPQGRLDPADMIARMIAVIPSRTGEFRNIQPAFVEEALKDHQRDMFAREI